MITHWGISGPAAIKLSAWCARAMADANYEGNILINWVPIYNENSFYNPTNGFAEGLKPKNYYDKMSLSKIVPCPSGAEVIDSFRFYEAIETLCLPIGDRIDSKGINPDFYNFVFGDIHPIKTLENWNHLSELLPNLLETYMSNMHKTVCWWIKYKRDLSIEIMRQVNAKV